MSDTIVLGGCAVATVDGSGAEYASGHLVAEPLLVNGEPVMDGGALRTADEREDRPRVSGRERAAHNEKSKA